MELSDRKKRILSAIIDEYIETAEPVGSKVIASKSGLNFSPATIRSEMAELTALEYLEQPHTSAGRIPSPKGYRLYVNELMRRHRLSVEEAERINGELQQRLQQIDRLIADIGRFVVQLTRYPALSLAPPARETITRFDLIHVDPNTFIIVALLSNNTVKNKLVHLPVMVEQEQIARLSTLFNAHFTNITEDEITANAVAAAERASGDTIGLTAAIVSFAIEILTEAGIGEAYVTGVSQLLEQPEFRDPDKAQRILRYLSDSDKLLELPAPDDSGVRVIIGPENIADELKDSSVVIASYNTGDNMRGLFGVVGPTRMNYAKVAARLKYLASGLSRIFMGELFGETDINTEADNKGDDNLNEKRQE